MAKAVNFDVRPRHNEDQMRMIRRFVKKTKKEGLIDKVRKRMQQMKQKQNEKIRMEKGEERKRMLHKPHTPTGSADFVKMTITFLRMYL